MKKFSLYIFIVYAILVISIVYLTNFINPIEDDFFWGIWGKQYGIWGVQEFVYLHFNGRFISTFLSTLVFSADNWLLIYRTIPLVLLISFTIISFFIFKRILGNKNYNTILILSFSFVFLLLFKLPQSSSFLYWMTATMVYTLSYIFSLLLIFLLFNQTKFKYLVFIPALLLGGTSEITAMGVLFILILILIVKYIETKKIDYFIIIILVTLAVSTFTNIYSNGSVNRAGNLDKFQPNVNLFSEIIKTELKLCSYIFDWFFLSPLIGLIYFISKYITVKINCTKKSKYVQLIGLILLIFVLIIPATIALKHVPPRRVWNLNYCFFISAYFYLLLLFNPELKYVVKSFDKKIKYLEFFSIGILCAGLLFQSSFRMQIGDIYKGRAKKYSGEVSNWYKSASNLNNDSCTLYLPKEIPISIVFDDVNYNDIYKENIKNFLLFTSKRDSLKINWISD